MRLPVDAKRIAAVLTYADEHGTAKACERFKISSRTLKRYRKRGQSDPALAPAVTEAREKVAASWLVEAGAARTKLLERVMELAAKTENLRDAVGALKIVSDSMLAYEVVNPDGGRPQPSPRVEASRGGPSETPAEPPGLH